MINLDFILQIAQDDSRIRNPRIKLLSQSPVADIPFDGQLLTSETVNEKQPNTIIHSSGRLISTYVYGPSSGVYYIKFFYTDVNRQQFSYTTLSIPNGHILLNACLCEIWGAGVAGVEFTDNDVVFTDSEIVWTDTEASGDQNYNVGLIFLTTSGNNYYLYYRIVTSTGTAVTSNTLIASWSTSLVTGSPSVIRKVDGTYLLVYAKYVSGDSHYHIYGRTSLDFISWSFEEELSAGIPQFGISSGDTMKKDSPFLSLIDNGTTVDLSLAFAVRETLGPNNEERWNIYVSILPSGGSIWGNATKVTGYTGYGTVGNHPVIVQKEAGNFYLIFTEQTGALHVDYTTINDTCGEDGTLNIVDIVFDDATRKLYAVVNKNIANQFESILEIDIDLWEVTRCWHQSSSPALPWWNNARRDAYGAGKYIIALGSSPNGPEVVTVLNTELDTVTNYNFGSNESCGQVQNVTWTRPGGTYEPSLVVAKVDLQTNRLYCFFYQGNIYDTGFALGYIDLTQPPDINGNYTLEWAITWQDYEHGINNLYGSGINNFYIIPEEDYIIFPFTGWSYSSNYDGKLLIYSLSDGSLVKHFQQEDDDPTFVWHGIRNLVYLDGKIYGVCFHNAPGDPNWNHPDILAGRNGICRIDLGTWEIYYYIPTFTPTYDYWDYRLTSLALTDDGNIIVGSNSYGIWILDPIGQSWTGPLINSTIPGMYLTGNGISWILRYDPVNDTIIYDASYDSVNLVSRYGFIKQSKYYTAVYSGSWTYGLQGEFVKGYLEYDAVAVPAPTIEKGLYVFWVDQVGTEYSIKWDYESGSFDLADYILRSQEILATRNFFSNEPARLEFSVSHGYMFDNFNALSLLSIYLRKGRKLYLQIGEEIDDVIHWVNQGYFHVVERIITYERPKYPVMQVRAEDKRTFWENTEIVATDNYASSPEDTIKDLLQDHADIPLVDFELGVWDNSTYIYVQYVDMDLNSIVEKIEDRFGYEIRVAVDNKIKAIKATANRSIDHIYTGKDWLFNLTPDDTYSDFTTRVIVKGQERTNIEVVYTEERILGNAITVLWNHGIKKYRHYYSDDKSRTCILPRLEIIDKVVTWKMQSAGGVTIEISDIDPNNKWCRVKVTAPDQTAALVGWIIFLVSTYFIPDLVKALGFFASVGWTTRIGSYLGMLAMFMISSILGSHAQIQYDIHAKPTGFVKRSIQSDEYHGLDTELKNELGKDYVKTIDEPLCYSVAQCNEVADHSIEIIRLQRRRIKVSKVAHLQDEIGDILQIEHPQTGLPMKLLIAEHSRRIKIPENQSNEGYVKDDITGWVA